MEIPAKVKGFYLFLLTYEEKSVLCDGFGLDKSTCMLYNI